MGWVALKQQKVKRGDGYVLVLPGEPIPEAEKWANRQAWINQKSIKWVDEVGDPPRGADAFAPAQAAPVSPATLSAASAETEPTGGAEPLTEADLDKLTKAEIVKLAAKRFGLKLSGLSRKATLVTAVLEAQQEA